MSRIIVNPHDFDGRRIGVYGVFAMYGAETYIFPNTESFKHRMEGDIVMVAVSSADVDRLGMDNELLVQAHGRFVFLEGQFSATRRNAIHPTDGTFYELSRFEIVPLDISDQSGIDQ